VPVKLIPDGREGLNMMHSYLRLKPSQSWAGFYVATDYAYQWNDRIAMASDAYSGEIGNQFLQLPKTPKLVYTYRSFQGDDRSTAKYEKFDPCFMRELLRCGRREVTVRSRFSIPTCSCIDFSTV
jgi:hypothetical protein